MAEGASPTLSVCNIAYRRAELDEIRDVWQDVFVDAVVNAVLQDRFGSLWLEPKSEVVWLRRIRLKVAMGERFTGGRLFGSLRAQLSSLPKRLSYVMLGPALPVVIFARMAAAAARSRLQFLHFMASLGPLAMLVLAWSWGEWLGYVTARRPRAFSGTEEARLPVNQIRSVDDLNRTG